MASSPPSDESDPLLAVRSEPWVILHTEPRVHPAELDRDLSLELHDPPRLSFLTVSTRVSPARLGTSSSVIRHPCILSADLSASLFFTITPTPHPPAGPTASSSSSSAATATGDCCYFVLDAASCTSHRVPVPVPGFASFGVIAAPDGASFMAVGIRCLIGNARASLQCFSSRTGVWVTRDVNNPRPHRAWTFTDVVAHDGKLWWVSTSNNSNKNKGLLYCDPFADQPSMSFVPFPKHVIDVEARAEATADDYVQVAGGRLRWVHVLCDLDETVDDAPSLNGAPLLSIYTVLGNGRDGGGGHRLGFELPAHWHCNFSRCFIWESDGFRKAEMPKDEQGRLALIDPNDTDLLYFFFGDYLLGFDICMHKMLGYAPAPHPHGMAYPDVPSSSSFLLPWKLPPALAAAPPGLARGAN